MRHTREMQPPASALTFMKFCTHLQEHEDSPIWVSNNQRRVPGGLPYIGALVPCGVLLQIPHSPIITTINHDTQPPALGVGWEEVAWGVFFLLWHLSYTCSLLWGWRSHEGQWLRAWRVRRKEDIICKSVQLAIFRVEKKHLLFHFSRFIISKHKRKSRKPVLARIHELCILLNAPFSAKTFTHSQKTQSKEKK